MQCTLPHLCSCACLSAGHELAFFYPLGIIEAHEDDYIHGVFGGLFGAFVDTLIGAFDNAENELAKFFITILLAYRMLSACSACALPAADAAAARAPCKRSRAQMPRAQTPPCALGHTRDPGTQSAHMGSTRSWDPDPWDQRLDPGVLEPVSYPGVQ